MNEAIHYVGNRPYTSKTEADTAFYDLPNYTVVAIEGANAREFLQGQITCDVLKVDDTHFQQGAFCNLKGRIIELADVFNWHGYKLLLPTDLVEDTCQALKNVAMLSRVQMQPMDTVNVFGLMTTESNVKALPLPPPGEGVSQDEMYCYNLGDNRYIWIALTSWRPSSYLGSHEWHKYQLEHQGIEIYPETRGLFLPHRLDLHRRNYISFEKGCYKGQEIIARMHYRATLKHGLRTFIISPSHPPQLGAKLLDAPDGRELGELIDFCALEDGTFLIAVSILLEHPNEAYLEPGAERIDLNVGPSF